MKLATIWRYSIVVFLGLMSCILLNGQDSTHIQFSGHVFFNTPSSSVTECMIDNHGLGTLKKHPLRFTNPDGASFLIHTDDSTGIYTVDTLLSTPIFTLSTSILDTLTLNGISTFDLVLISKHILNIETLNCPMSRIAADVNNSGTITANDMVTLRQLILNIITEYPDLPSMRIVPIFFAPKSYTFQQITPFTNAFWDNTSGPFDAKINLMGGNQQYKEDTTHDSWMGGIKNWRYYPEDSTICRKFKYDFYVIKTGDVNQSALLDKIPNSDPGNVRITPNFTNVEYSIDNSATVSNLEMVIKIKSLQPMDAYQLGLKVDSSAIKINSIETIENIRQTLRDNYNTKVAELESGNIRTSWNINFEEQKEGVNIKNFTEIIRLDVELLKDINQDEMANFITFDSELLPFEFISDFKIVNFDEIEILIELREKK